MSVWALLLACGGGADPVEPAEAVTAEAPIEVAPEVDAASMEPAPSSNPPVPESAGEVSAVLVQSWDANLALVTCLSPEGLRRGANCSDILLPGTELSHGSQRVKVTTPTTLDCVPLGTKIAATGANSLGQAEAPESWSWQPGPPLGWEPSSPSKADDALAEAVRAAEKALLVSQPATEITLVATADLNGDGTPERVLAAFHSSDDAEKRGYTTLWLADPAVKPLPTQGMEINGQVIVRGTAPITTGGELLVFTSTWMGGSGVHAVGPLDGKIGAVGEVACGS